MKPAAGNPGRFVTLEGIEGVGKSTNLLVADYLRSRGLEVTVTTETGGVPVAERILEVLLDARGEVVPHMTE